MILDPSAFRGLCRARELLADTCLRPKSIQLAAREARMSQFHFIRRFRAVFGVTPHQYRMARRIDHAKQLLALGQYSVTEICVETGMSSLGSFSDLFLQRVGATPSAFRRQARTVVHVPGILPVQLFPGCLNLFANLPHGTIL